MPGESLGLICSHLLPPPSDTMDMQQWIAAINRAAATYSAAPLAAPVSSSIVFQRPTYPMAPTKNSREQQIEAHEAKVRKSGAWASKIALGSGPAEMWTSLCVHSK